MNLNEFDAWTIAERTDTKKMTEEQATVYNILCLCSEAGEVADARKLFTRTDKYRSDTFGYTEDILLELGDVLHYVCRIAADHGFSLQDVADANVEKLTNRKKYGKGGHGKRS